MAEPHAGADLEQAGRRPPASPPPTPIPSRSAARHSSTGSPTGSAAATSSSRCVSAGSAVEPSPEAVLDPARQRRRVPAARIRRRAPPASARAAARAAPADCRASRRRSGRAPARPAARGSPSPAARAHHRHADPRRRAPAALPSSSLVASARAAKTSATDSASSRRATNAERLRRGPIQPLRVVDHAQQRPLLGHLRQQAQRGQPDEEAIRRVPGAQAERRAQAHRAADPAAARADPASARTADAAPANASSISDSTPTARTTLRSDAASIAYSSSAVLPTPGSPRTTRARLSPVADRLEQPVELPDTRCAGRATLARARARAWPAHTAGLRPKGEPDMTDPRHLLLVGTGPGLGAAIAAASRARGTA